MIEFTQADRELMRDVSELHVHAMPDFFDRPFDEIELARQCRDVGYRAILFKCHHAINADRAQMIRKIVSGIEVFGGVVLNYPLGGINPEAVDAAIAFGAKEVWMPTIHSAHHINYFGAPTYPRHTRVGKATKTREIQGITIFDDEGEILPEVYEILNLIADADIILGTSHLSLKETFALIEAAKKNGVKKILVTHPEWELTNWPIEEQVQMADKGAILEHCFSACMPLQQKGKASDPTTMMKAIRRVGVN
ncbi:MAG: hypothetical protein GTN80_10775, partial [Nitrososphaeria archaeon]|nr:hypothetical protein [Nitrososphaeria archaeon]NIN53582.1 hypothetical protein [Nitrososphaeria archaeon]NIQ34103.1 hypothetical protein [Nitrososphaeria archaeon]